MAVANIGKELEEIEVVPLPAPVEPETPAEQPSVPAQPDRELVPAGE